MCYPRMQNDTTISRSSGKSLNHFRELKQDKQCTYNVTLKRVRVTIVAVEK
jgi:hypothetical protein